MVFRCVALRRAFTIGSSFVLLLVLASAVLAEDLSIVDVGRFRFADDSGSGATELSGITYAGGSTYYAVSDEVSKLFKLTVLIDQDSGAIRSASIDQAPRVLCDRRGAPLGAMDREGVALAGTSVFIAGEYGPQINQHDLASGHRMSRVMPASHPTLNVFSKLRSNRGWESLTCQSNGLVFWTANEEALVTDGPPSATSTGSAIRLQKFDMRHATLKPAGQWVYETDPIGPNFGIGAETCGVVDLAALDDDRLLVMERAVGIGFRIRIYWIELADATDVSDAKFGMGLLGQMYRPVSKKRLFEKKFPVLENGNANFEGMTLGPTLNDGSRSLILVADNGSGHHHALYALRLVAGRRPQRSGRPMS